MEHETRFELATLTLASSQAIQPNLWFHSGILDSWSGRMGQGCALSGNEVHLDLGARAPRICALQGPQCLYRAPFRIQNGRPADSTHPGHRSRASSASLRASLQHSAIDLIRDLGQRAARGVISSPSRKVRQGSLPGTHARPNANLALRHRRSRELARGTDSARPSQWLASGGGPGR